MPITPADLAATPDHFLHRFEGEDAIFVAMDAAAYRRSIFLDRRISPAGDQEIQVPVAALLQLLGQPQSQPATPPPLGWIFHMAHCGSTLLARALGELGDNIVLREPFALRQLAFEPDPARLGLVMAMLARRYAAHAPTIVKANVPVNFLLPAITAHHPGGCAIMLHCQLPDYLLAILRSDNHRGWLRNVTTQLAGHLGDLSRASDAQRAAALWLAQTRRFANALRATPDALRATPDALRAMPDARSLDAEQFFANPGATLAAVADHLGVTAKPDAIAALVAGPLFATYSKNPALAFDNAARLARREALEPALSTEISEARHWLDQTAGDLDAINSTIRAHALIA